MSQSHTLNTDADLAVPARGKPKRRTDFDWTAPHPSGYTRHEYAYRRMMSTDAPTWDALAAEVGCNRDHMVAWWRIVRPREPDGKPTPRPTPVVNGQTVNLPRMNPERVWERLEERQAEYDEEVAARGENTFALPRGVGAVGVAFMGDLHIGGNAYYREMRRDAELVRDHGMYAVLLGDYLNNWVVGRLMGQQKHELVRHAEALAAFKWWLGVVGPQLMAVVGGNHDAWSDIAGWDYIRPALAEVNPNCLYDPGRLQWRMDVGAASKTLLVQHKWRGNSMYNSTHAIERAARFPVESGNPAFDIGAAGHVHSCAVVRPFYVGGPHPRIAVQVGTYKRDDSYGKANGFATPIGLGAASVVIEEDGMVSGFPNVELGADFLAQRRKAWGVA